MRERRILRGGSSPAPRRRGGSSVNNGDDSLRIDGLWALAFGRGVANNGERDSLYFTAGPDQEQGGMFGYLTAAPAPGRE
jgi:hypothetical protein